MFQRTIWRKCQNLPQANIQHIISDISAKSSSLMISVSSLSSFYEKNLKEIK